MTIQRLKTEAARHHVDEILLAHNGLKLSLHDESRLRAHLAPTIKLLHTDRKGIGAGYKLGIESATSRYVVLSASDLPFGWTDIEAFQRQSPVDFAIGSKAHPQSQLMDLTLKRRCSSFFFYWTRRILLGPKTPGDSQGSLIIKRELAKEIATQSGYDNYLFSLEAACLHLKNGGEIHELPVTLENNTGESSVSVLRDGLQMLRDLIDLSKRMRGSE